MKIVRNKLSWKRFNWFPVSRILVLGPVVVYFERRAS